MKKNAAALDLSTIPIPSMPVWVSAARAETSEDAAFWSGAALAHLHLVAAGPTIPHALWRARLALAAAEACAGFSGRRERAAELRDAVHLLRLGDHPGPAGEIFRQWGCAVARPISLASLGKVLPDIAPEQIALCLDAGQRKGREGTPVDRTVAVLEAVLADAPRAEVAALILADAALARALGWDYVLPLLAVGLKTRDLGKRGDDLRLACHQGLVTAAGHAVVLAADLTRKAARLRAVTPKLRARCAKDAVEIFLARDVLAPVALAIEVRGAMDVRGGMSDRAARRFCDRLVELGALRELTGRDSFRLYGV